MAAVDVSNALESIYNELDEKQQQNECIQQCLIHFGLNSDSSEMHIEKQAVNDASFSIPDERGWQP